MKILVIGQGGREHALAWKLSQSKKSEKSIEITEKNNFPKIKRNIDSKEDNIDVKLKSELLNEFSDIKKSLFNKKVYIDSIEQENQTMFNYLVNFMSGFFNLRDYRDNSNPRSILTKAEMSAKEGNLENLIYKINWKNYEPVTASLSPSDNNIQKNFFKTKPEVGSLEKIISLHISNTNIDVKRIQTYKVQKEYIKNNIVSFRDKYMLTLPTNLNNYTIDGYFAAFLKKKD